MLELFGLIVGRVGVNPEYVLDEMGFAEFDAIMSAHTEKERAKWEQTRLISYYTVAPHAAKKLKSIEKFMPFDWDKKPTDNKKQPTNRRKPTMEEIREFSKI